MAELANYQGKRVAIAGFGAEGRSALNYFRSHGADVVIVDEAESLADLPDGVETILGPNALESLNGFDIISRTPPLRPDRLPSGPIITSVTIEFFEHCTAPIIAVTGTKGKGTTTTLVAEILKNAGKTVHLVGNIGVPALDILDQVEPEDIVCYEISSFQLWDLKKSPHIGVVLMVAEDHLDVHSSREEYFEAKSNIARYQQPNDTIIVHPSNANSARIAQNSPAKKLHFQTEQGAHIRGEDLIIDEQKVCSVADVGLIGKFNLENVTAAVTAAWQFTQDIPAIATAVKEFKGLEHRLEFVAQKGGVDYYNDSFSATPSAAVAASSVFGNKSIMIYGGYDKNIHYCEISDAAKKNDIKHAILIGDIAEELQSCFVKAGFDRFQIARGDINNVVATASSLAKSGDKVILSPGTSSFDMFNNYKERGQLFKEAVNNLP